MSIWYIMSEILNGFHIRPLGAGDVDAIMQLDGTQQSKKKFTAQNQFGIVAERKTEIVGYLSFSFVYRSWEINRILVAEDQRRQGIATAMVTKLSGALDDVTPRIFTYVAESNLGAQCFLRKHGFRAVPGMHGAYTRNEVAFRLGESGYLMVYSLVSKSAA